MNVNPRKVEYNSTDKLVYVEIYINTAPSPLPETSDDLSCLKPGYHFEVGSFLYITTTGDVYMANGDDTWTKQ